MLVVIIYTRTSLIDTYFCFNIHIRVIRFLGSGWACSLSLCGKADCMHKPHSSLISPQEMLKLWLFGIIAREGGGWAGCSLCHICLTYVSFSCLVCEYVEGKDSLLVPYSSLSLLPSTGLGTEQVFSYYWTNEIIELH